MHGRDLCNYELALAGKKDSAAHPMSDLAGSGKAETKKPAKTK